jgi:hypothetical protein
MGRLTLRLPESLHAILIAHAKQEGISLNQYVVFALTQQTSQHRMYQRTHTDIEEQRERYQVLLDSLHRTDLSHARAVLQKRKSVAPSSEQEVAVMTRWRAYKRQKSKSESSKAQS